MNHAVIGILLISLKPGIKGDIFIKAVYYRNDDLGRDTHLFEDEK